MNQSVKFGELDFNGNLIQLIQSAGFDMMVNATEMARPFGINKQPTRWLRLKEAKDYINSFKAYVKSDMQNLHIIPLEPVMTVRGIYADGTRQGTWMHRWVAIRFAQWLHPDFAVWIDQKIDELLQNGFTTALQEERDKYNAILPKADFCNQVLQTSENLYSTEQLCKDMNLGINSKILIQRLINNNLAFRRQDGKWFLASPYDSFGYMRTITILDKKTKKPRNVKRWTENGRYWIWSLKGKVL